MTILLLDKFGRVPDVAKYLYSFAAARWPASVVLAETKDHMDWELIGQCSEELEGAEAKALKQAYEELEDQEDVDLYHTKSWCRELWIESLGMAAVLPPPEETKQVKTAIGAAKAEQSRTLELE